MYRSNHFTRSLFTLLIGLLMAGLMNVRQTYASPQQIPIGAIFASDDVESRAAFLLAIDLFNERNNSRFKLQPIVDLIHRNEPFTFTHQRK